MSIRIFGGGKPAALAILGVALFTGSSLVASERAPVLGDLVPELARPLDGPGLPTLATLVGRAERSDPFGNWLAARKMPAAPSRSRKKSSHFSHSRCGIGIGSAFGGAGSPLRSSLRVLW